MKISYQKIDWNKEWQKHISLNKKLRGNVDCVKFWSGQKAAVNYWKSSQENDSKAKETIKQLKLKPSYSVLDIGAGPGNLAIPISKEVKRVTALEPSPGMFRVLKRNIKDLKIKNIKTINSRWEKANIKDKFDIVLASYCFGMKDIRKSLLKMNEASKGYVFLFWFATSPGWNIRTAKLRKLLGRKTLPENPKANVLYNVLLQNKIFPNVVHTKRTVKREYANIEEAAEFFLQREPIKTVKEKDILYKFIKRAMPIINGKYTIKDNYIQACLWWKKDEV
jgi:ubiquinone/menaquinone biosynthesis C-methylase UbiE